tara:strand:+ start:488 stop:823 length:336 start_codon:yes stop_codon:yes gene_type:complete
MIRKMMGKTEVVFVVVFLVVSFGMYYYSPNVQSDKRQHSAKNPKCIEIRERRDAIAEELKAKANEMKQLSKKVKSIRREMRANKCKAGACNEGMFSKWMLCRRNPDHRCCD